MHEPLWTKAVNVDRNSEEKQRKCKQSPELIYPKMGSFSVGKIKEVVLHISPFDRKGLECSKDSIKEISHNPADKYTDG